MCGFAGILDTTLGTPGLRLRGLATAMADRLRHRGPDAGAAWADPDAGIALAFRRLAVVDLSPAGQQPMASADGRWRVMLNGEIYDAEDQRRALPGVRWRGHSDTEVLTELIATRGFEAAVAAVNGMFALVAWDTRERVLWLARDRIGKKPLHYAWAGPHFIFGSELKALQAHPSFDDAIDDAALSAFLRAGHVPGAMTIYASARKLRAGHILRMPAGQPGRWPEPYAYWTLAEVARAGIEERAAGRFASMDELAATLTDSVRIRMVADVGVGAFLSGGIDSSLVTALMAAQGGPDIRTFALGLTGAPWNEAPDASRVARHLGTRHTQVDVGPNDILGTVLGLPAMFDEPFADDSAIPTAIISRFARTSVTVALSGDGGDELFAGYNRYPGLAQWLRRGRAVPTALRPVLGALAADLAAPAFDRAHAHRLARRARLFQALMANPSPSMFAAHVAAQMADPGQLLAGGRAGPAEQAPSLGGTALEDLLLLDAQVPLTDGILTKVDRASMAASLEVRCPLLDHRIVALSWRMPPRARLNGTVGKQALRDLLARHVPEALTNRPKMGFGAPMAQWLKHGLHGWADSLMSGPALARSGRLDVAACQRLWTGFDTHGFYDRALWNVLMFQAWHAHSRQERSSERECAAAG